MENKEAEQNEESSQEVTNSSILSEIQNKPVENSYNIYTFKEKEESIKPDISIEKTEKLKELSLIVCNWYENGILLINLEDFDFINSRLIKKDIVEIYLALNKLIDVFSININSKKDKNLKEHFVTQESEAAQIKTYLNTFKHGLLKDIIKHEVKKLYPTSKNLEDSNFGSKLCGVRLGFKVTIEFEDFNGVKQTDQVLYVKTHANGENDRITHCENDEPVDLKEICVYKILEQLGVGPRVHIIFGDNITECYIATVDAGFDESNQKQFIFYTYEQLVEQVNDGVEELEYQPILRKDEKDCEISQNSLQIVNLETSNILTKFDRNIKYKLHSPILQLHKLHDIWILSQIEMEAKIKGKTLTATEFEMYHETNKQIESKLADDERKFIRDFTLVDILSRIFCLTDVVTNEQNFGFSYNDKELKLNIVDFAVVEDAYERFNVYLGFWSGNSHFKFNEQSDKAILYIMLKRHALLREATAKDIIQEIKPEILNAIETATTYVLLKVKKYEEFSTEIEREKEDFEEYILSVEKNLDVFSQFQEPNQDFVEEHKQTIILKTCIEIEIPELNEMDVPENLEKEEIHIQAIETQFNLLASKFEIAIPKKDVWHLTFYGTKNEEFEGMYHVELHLHEYPFKAPHFMFVNENGAFLEKLYKFSEISINKWNNKVSINEIIDTIENFMLSDNQEKRLEGMLTTNTDKLGEITKESRNFRCSCGINHEKMLKKENIPEIQPKINENKTSKNPIEEQENESIKKTEYINSKILTVEKLPLLDIINETGQTNNLKITEKLITNETEKVKSEFGEPTDKELDEIMKKLKEK